MRKLLRWAPALALTLAVPLAAQSDPAALVVQVAGDVQVHHGPAQTPAAVGQRLVVGDQVVPASGARAILITRTGANQVVTSSTTVSAPAAGGNADIFERAMKTLAQAASADARTAGGRQGMIRPIPGEPTLVAPRNGLVVAGTRPTFTWMAADNAKGDAYTIQIRALAGGRPVRFQVTGTTFTLPADAQELVAGGRYQWTVAPQGGRAAMPVEFQVLGDAGRAQLSTTLGQITNMGLDPAGNGAFLAAVVYRDMNLVYEARKSLEAVEEAGTMAADAYLLKGEILQLLGHSEEARKAFDKADEMMR